MAEDKSHVRACLLAGVACALLVLGWQLFIVTFLYGGNWTGLFFTGDKLPVPPQLAGESIYVHSGSHGYDGQFYHYVAHDPLRRSELHKHVDSPFRYGRILVPGLAYLLAAGRQDLIDRAYYAVILLFVFLGAYWTGRYACLHGRHAAWGIAFALVPGVLISMDRLTVEVALCALTAAFALYVVRGPAWKLYLVLVAAALTRESGMLLAAGYCLHSLSRWKWKSCAGMGTSVLPALLWYGFMLQDVVVHPRRMLGSRGVLGIVRRLWTPATYPFGGLGLAVVHALDWLGWLGMLMALLMGYRAGLTRKAGPMEYTAALMGLFGLAIRSTQFWTDPNGYLRPFSPLLMLLGLRLLSERRWLGILPLCLVDLRLGWELAYKAFQAVRAILS